MSMHIQRTGSGTLYLVTKRHQEKETMFMPRNEKMDIRVTCTFMQSHLEKRYPFKGNNSVRIVLLPGKRSFPLRNNSFYE